MVVFGVLATIGVITFFMKDGHGLPSNTDSNDCDGRLLH